MSNIYSTLAPLQKARLSSILTRTKQGIETYILKQQALVDNAVERAKRNIKNKIEQQDIHSLEDFKEVAIIYNEDEYDKLLSSYNELVRKYDTRLKEFELLQGIYRFEALRNQRNVVSTILKH